MVVECLLAVVYVGLLMVGGWWFVFGVGRKGRGGGRVGVVVALRNEEKSVEQLLNALAIQKHAPAQVVLVNDGSTDRTFHLLRKTAECLPVRTLIINTPPQGKARALQLGIYHTSSPFVAITDADCQPSPSWLEALTIPCGGACPSLVVGYVAEVPSRGFWQHFQYMEMAGMMVFNAGMARLWVPVTATSASLLISRDTYAQLGGHTTIQKHLSGDDLFLLREVVRHKGRKAVCLAPTADAVVFTPASPSFGQMLSRRHRWASKLTTLHWLPNLLAVALVVAVNLLLYCWVLSGEGFRAALALLKVGADFLAVVAFSTVTHIWRWLPYFMFGQAMYPLYLVYVGLWALAVPRRKW